MDIDRYLDRYRYNDFTSYEFLCHWDSTATPPSISALQFNSSLENVHYFSCNGDQTLNCSYDNRINTALVVNHGNTGKGK